MDQSTRSTRNLGFISLDLQMLTNVPHVFTVGNIVGQPMLAHKAHVAEEVIAGELHGNQKLVSAALTHSSSPAWPTPTLKWPGLT